MSERAQFATKTGVIAATVGSAVGLGNIWRFPYEAGMHGGGAFLIIYVLCVLLVGIPVVVSEFVLGRGTHSNAKGAVNKLRPGSVMRWVPLLGVLASILIWQHMLIHFFQKKMFMKKMVFVTGQTLVNIMLETQAFLKEAGEHSYQL